MLNNLRGICDHYGVTNDDFEMARQIIGGNSCRQADLPIEPGGNPYLYRWHVIPHNNRGNVFFHIQVASDPERPLHDHPWDNTSVILAGGYMEVLDCVADGEWSCVPTYSRRTGQVVHRKADWAHRLLMPEGVPYTMTLFSTGPKIRKWGFWYPEGWVDADEVCQLIGNKSVHVKKGGS